MFISYPIKLPKTLNSLFSFMNILFICLKHNRNRLMNNEHKYFSSDSAIKTCVQTDMVPIPHLVTLWIIFKLKRKLFNLTIKIIIDPLIFVVNILLKILFCSGLFVIVFFQNWENICRSTKIYCSKKLMILYVVSDSTFIRKVLNCS